MKILCPAKINLFFSILNKRSDGYHEVITLLQAIDFFDTLEGALSSEDRFFCSDSTLPLDQTNLVIKALNLFREKTNFDHPVTLHLEKQIPQKAGLGGGSSNAASTLYLLNELFEAPLSIQELQTLSQSLGSDVPFFFSSGTALCTGRGEIVQDTHLPFHLEGTLFIPTFSLSTPEVFQKSTIDKRAFWKWFENDLQEAASRVNPQLNVPPSWTLTGSGSALFSLEKKEIPTISGKMRPFKAVQKGFAWY